MAKYLFNLEDQKRKGGGGPETIFYTRSNLFKSVF